MSIERELTEEGWGKLSNDDQALYERDGESYKFIGVNPSKLVAAKNRERDLANKYKKEFLDYKEAQARGQEEEPEPTSKSKDDGSASELQKLRRKLEEKEKRHQKELQVREAELRESVLRRHISSVVSQVFEDSHIGEMILEKRMDVQIQDGKAKLLIKNREGEVDDDMGVAELIKDLNSDDRYKDHRKGSRASGGEDMNLGMSQSPMNAATDINSFVPSGSTKEDLAVATYMQGKSISEIDGRHLMNMAQSMNWDSIDAKALMAARKGM